MAIDNVALVRRMVDQVWNAGNYNVFDELLSTKIKEHDPLLGDTEGLEAAKTHARLFRTAYPDLNVAIDDISTVADKVYVRWTATGTHKGTLMGFAPTNRRGIIHGITINRFDGGKLVETYWAWDVYSMLEQLGLLPPVAQLVSRGGVQPTARA